MIDHYCVAINESQHCRCGGINLAKGCKSKNKSKYEEEIMRMVGKSKEIGTQIVKFKRFNEN